MTPDPSKTMAEALRLTRAGRLTEATGVLQRGLASADTAAPSEPIAGQGFADLGGVRSAVSTTRPLGRPDALGGYAAPGRRGLVQGPIAKPPDPLDAVSRAEWPRSVRSSGCGAAPGAAAVAGGGIRHLTHPESARARRHSLHIPPRYTGPPLPLLLLPHGGKPAR